MPVMRYPGKSEADPEPGPSGHVGDGAEPGPVVVGPLPAALPARVEDDLALRRLIAGWLLSFDSANTRAGYGRDLARWLDWCTTHQFDPLTVRRAHVDAYARWREGQVRVLKTGREIPTSRASIARALAALSSFYGYALAEEAIVASPLALVRRPRLDEESPTLGLDRDQARAFLAAAAAAGHRDQLLALLLLHNGLRVSEACGARVEDLDVDRGHRVLRGAGKAGKRWTATLTPATVAVLDRYLTGRTAGLVLLDNTRTTGLDRHDATRIVRRLARHAGLTQKLSPHSMRHTSITAALDAGASLRDVQDFARHADPRTTRRYDRARHNHDRNPAYAIAAYLAGDDRPETDQQ